MNDILDYLYHLCTDNVNPLCCDIKSHELCVNKHCNAWQCCEQIKHELYLCKLLYVNDLKPVQLIFRVLEK